MRWVAAGLSAAAVAILAVALALPGAGGSRPVSDPVASSYETAGTGVVIPRVCWFSDYEAARLSNQCRFDSAASEWLIERDGAWVPASRQQLPTANLCHYFYGEECPSRRGAAKVRG